MVPLSISSGVQWTDVVVAVAAALGTIAAIVAGAVALGQLRSAEAGRREQLRPVVLFERAALLPGVPGKKFVELRFANHGPGPALETEARVRIFPMDGKLVQDASARTTFIQTCIASLSHTPPAGYIAIHGIGPGQTSTVYLMNDNQEVLIDCHEDQAAVIITVKYEDVFGKQFAYPAAADPKKSKFIFRIARLEDRFPNVVGT